MHIPIHQTQTTTREPGAPCPYAAPTVHGTARDPDAPRPVFGTAPGSLTFW